VLEKRGTSDFIYYANTMEKMRGWWLWRKSMNVEAKKGVEERDKKKRGMSVIHVNGRVV